MMRARERDLQECIMPRHHGMSRASSLELVACVWTLYRLIVKRVQKLP
jgi:hypothetical protein